MAHETKILKETILNINHKIYQTLAHERDILKETILNINHTIYQTLAHETKILKENNIKYKPYNISNVGT